MLYQATTLPRPLSSLTSDPSSCPFMSVLMCLWFQCTQPIWAARILLKVSFFPCWLSPTDSVFELAAEMFCSHPIPLGLGDIYLVSPRPLITKNKHNPKIQFLASYLSVILPEICLSIKEGGLCGPFCLQRCSFTSSHDLQLQRGKSSPKPST